MPECISEHTYKDDLGRIAADILETMLGIAIQRVERQWQPEGGRLTGAVYLAGAWKGAVLLECDHRQAAIFTGRLMAVPTPAEIDDDVRDTIGELVNMLGGNLKSVLPHGVYLSLPSVIEGGNYSLRICGIKAAGERRAYSSPAGVFWITLVELPEA
jgi:chemotaxis protein CheX